MKKLCLLIAALLLPGLAWGNDGIGTMFTKVNAYLYADGPEKGKRFLVRSRESLTVVGLATDKRERIWFRVRYPEKLYKVSGEGWTPLSPAETLNAGPEGVPVYASTIERDKADTNVIMVPSGDLELLNVTQNSKRFPQIIWQKVAYATSKPIEPWIRGATGIYRPGKDRDFIQNSYEEMVSRNVEKDTLFRLVAGVVRVGDAAQQVQWALGKPLRVQEETSGKNVRVIWHYPRRAVRIRDDVVEQIN